MGRNSGAARMYKPQELATVVYVDRLLLCLVIFRVMHYCSIAMVIQINVADLHVAAAYQ